MTGSNERTMESIYRRLIGNRPIRWKLAIGFGALLALGLLNIALYYWSAQQRSQNWEEVQRAIERQTIIMEVQNRLSNQKKYVDLVSGVLGIQEQAQPNPIDEQNFAMAVDTIAIRLLDMIQLAGPGRRAELEALHSKTDRLAESWKRFYNYQWTQPTDAIEELYVTAEPLAQELLVQDLPAAVQFEKAAMASISSDYVRTEQTFAQIAWISFLLSALVGGALAVFVSRDLLRSISVLRTGTERIGRGELGDPIPVFSQDELGEVAASFNDMSERLKARTDELARQRDQIEGQRDDLTQTLERLRTTQAKLVQQEKLASLGALTAGIAHEIKNPLNFINNFAALCEELSNDLDEEIQAIEAGDGDTKEVRDLLDSLKTNARKIKEHGQRADSIVKSMLLHSRGKSGDREKADVNDLVDEYVTLAYHGMRAQRADFDVRFERDYDPRVGTAEVVPQELGRVFINLLQNAFYAVYEKAAQCPPEFQPQVAIRTNRRQDAVEIHFADNGDGIPKDVVERIFEPFFTTKPTGDGTGLGLSLSYDIITQLHGGTIDVTSTPGEGTEFTIVLPSADGSPTHAA